MFSFIIFFTYCNWLMVQMQMKSKIVRCTQISRIQMHQIQNKVEQENQDKHQAEVAQFQVEEAVGLQSFKVKYE